MGTILYAGRRCIGLDSDLANGCNFDVRAGRVTICPVHTQALAVGIAVCHRFSAAEVAMASPTRPSRAERRGGRPSLGTHGVKNTRTGSGIKKKGRDLAT